MHTKNLKVFLLLSESGNEFLPFSFFYILTDYSIFSGKALYLHFVCVLWADAITAANWQVSTVVCSNDATSDTGVIKCAE